MNISSFGRRILQAADATVFGTILGLGTAAVKNTGTSGNTVPLLDGANTWSGASNTFKTGQLIVGATDALTSNTNPALVLGKRVSGSSETIGFSDGAGGYRGNFGVNGAGSWDIRIGDITTTDLTIDALGALTLTGGGISGVGWLSRGAPVTKTADFTVAATENNLINNKAAATCTVTLPAAASFTGREVLIKTIVAFTVVSASSNVVPLAGGAASTAILAATAGKWAKLVSDGTNWVIMAAA